MSCDIVLVRHAESVPPAPGKPDDPERPLTEAGVAASEQLAHELVAMNPTAVVSSPYRRAVDTVTPAAKRAGLEVVTSWGLREWDSGLEPIPDYAAHYERAWADPEFARPGGESLRELTARALAAVERLAEQHVGGRVVVGSHGTFVSRLLAGLGPGIDWPFSRDMPMPAVHRLRWPGRSWASLRVLPHRLSR
ncbi:MAG TPA: histidine phosphatase family protein [Amycolatopsis sp.]|nr:histidine phosphatase family protein [Amycolatopsis sp.]